MATKAELEKQLEEKQKIIDEHKARIKAQNESAKERWETVSCRLPKGTKARINALGLTINGVINESVLAYLDCMEEAFEEETAQNAEISPERVGTAKYTPTDRKSLTEPQDTPETHISNSETYQPEFFAVPPENRDKWQNVQSVEELQAMLEAKREEEKRKQAERDQAKSDELEQERQENLSIMMGAIEKAMCDQKQREKSDSAELESMEDDSADFPEYSEENIKDVLRGNGYFREHVVSHVYKNAMIEKYGASNYTLFRKCLQEVENEEKEAKRQESIARANMEINQ